MDCNTITIYRQILLYDYLSFLCVLPSNFCVTQFYLFLLVAFNSETLYIEVHSRMASAFALFVSAGIYAAIFAYLYWDRYVNIDRKLDLKRYHYFLFQLAIVEKERQKSNSPVKIVSKAKPDVKREPNSSQQIMKHIVQNLIV